MDIKLRKLVAHHWTLHDSFQEDEVQVIGCGGAGAVTQGVQKTLHCWGQEDKMVQAISELFSMVY